MCTVQSVTVQCTYIAWDFNLWFGSQIQGISTVQYFCLEVHTLHGNLSKTENVFRLPWDSSTSMIFCIFCIFGSAAGWIILGTTMLLFSFIIALFPRHLSQTSPHKAPSSPISENITNTTQLLHEEQPLTKAMLSDFMPNDPVSTKQKEILHVQDASVKNMEGTALMILWLFSTSVSTSDITVYSVG